MRAGIVMDAVRFAHPGGAGMAFDLALPPRCFALLTGPSGSGKSTLLSLLAGFETPEAGTISLAGADVTGLPPAARPVTIVFQEHNTFLHLDVVTNVALGIAPRRIGRADRERAQASLERVGLARYGTRLPGQLSGGERQRVALARAALRDRPVLLLDEPFAALGPALRADMLSLVAGLAAERGGERADGHARSTGGGGPCQPCGGAGRGPRPRRRPAGPAAIGRSGRALLSGMSVRGSGRVLHVGTTLWPQKMATRGARPKRPACQFAARAPCCRRPYRFDASNPGDMRHVTTSSRRPFRRSRAASVRALLLAAAIAPAACTTSVLSVGEPRELLAPVPVLQPADEPITVDNRRFQTRESRMGAKQHPAILRAYGGVYPDPKLERTVARVVGRLTAATPDQGETYRVTLLDSPSVNAFALPGGYLYVTRGLLALADDSAELAAVLAHEMAHVIADHGIARARREEATTVAARVAGRVMSDAEARIAMGAR